ncbi:MAG: hypothetical protein ACLU38_03845 [Dysosmobacter sp.]
MKTIFRRSTVNILWVEVGVCHHVESCQRQRPVISISGELNSPYARLTVAPMCLHVGGQDYLDTPELDIPALLSKLAHHPSPPPVPLRRLCRGL